MSQAETSRFNFNAFFGTGYIHIQQASSSDSSKRWEWQVYLNDAPQYPAPEDPSYQGHFRTRRLALQSATLWLWDYFILD